MCIMIMIIGMIIRRIIIRILLGMILIQVGELPPHPSLAPSCLQKTCKLILKEIPFHPKENALQL